MSPPHAARPPHKAEGEGEIEGTNSAPDVSTGVGQPDDWEARQKAGAWVQPAERVVVEPTDVAGLVNWHDLLARGAPEPEWLVEPLLPAGRLTAIVAPAKAGKSLFVLELALSLALGRRFLDKPAGEPKRVLLLDFEMTEADVAERAEDMGVTAGDADRLAQNLHYYVTPSLPALNTPSGATRLLALVDYFQPDLLIVDTLSRAVAGDENTSEVALDAYRYTWQPLKARGVAVLRLDHTGHADRDRARGSSAKRDDVDLSWTMRPTDGGVRLAHGGTSRLAWVPAEVELIRSDDAPLHRLAAARGWPAGTAEWADLLDSIDAPADLGERKLRAWLKADDCRQLLGTGKDTPPRGEVLRAAIKYRNDPTRAARGAA